MRAPKTFAPKKGRPPGRPYSLDYTAAGTPRRYLLSGIPAQLWIRCRAQAKREHIAMRPLILSLLEGWLLSRNPETQFDEVLKVSQPLARRQLQRSAAAHARQRDVPDEE